jgi:uncharacterized protein YhhL (DUF1145 family)
MNAAVAGGREERRPTTGKLWAGDRAAWRRPPGWLWPVSIAAQVAITAVLTSYTYFFFDDFLFLQQARTQHFGLSYLREPLFEHFSPLSRILDTALVHIAPGSFALAHGIQLVLYAGAIAAFAAVVRAILGNSWTAFTLTAMFGQSVVLMRLLDWWTATANMLPATVLGLISIVTYLHWRERRSRLSLCVSLGAYAISLLDYETAMLFPIYLVLITLLVLEDELSPRAWLKALWRERWAWIGYGVLELLALWNYYEYYYVTAVKPPLHELAHYLWIALFETFVPALVGIKNPQAPISNHAWVILLAGLVVATVVALTLYMRPRAWRALLAFLIVFPLTMLPVGINRISQFGIGIAYEVRYQQSVEFMFFVLAAFALSARWGGRRPSSDRLQGFLASHRPSPAVLALAGALAVAGYGALYVTSVDAMANSSWEPRETHAYINNFDAGVRHVKAQTGAQPDLIDHEVPGNIMPSSFVPFNHYDEFFGMIDTALRVDQIADPAYVLNSTGELLPVRFDASASGMLRGATVSAPDGSGTIPAWSTQAAGACVPTGQPDTRLHVHLATPQAMSTQVSGLPYALRVRFRIPVRTSVDVLLANSQSVILDSGWMHIWGPGAGGELALLSVMTTVEGVALELPQGSCVTSLAFGMFSFAGAPVK